MPARMRVIFSKAESGDDYAEVARGTWVPGRDPVLTGEPIPPEVLKGLEVQVCSTREESGVLTYARADTKYAVNYEVIA